jgi:adenylate cyclase
MNTEEFKRKLTAILSADVEGYSRLMGESEITTIETLKDYREVMYHLIQQFHGRVVDSPGDNLLAEFGSVVDAVECAAKIQEELKTKNADLPDNRKMEFRIGVNLGEVVVDGDRIYGQGINIAARIEALAKGGGICVSRNVYEQVKNKVNLNFEYIGEETVKNITEPIHMYRVLTGPEDSMFPFGKSLDLELPEKPSIAVLPFNNMTGSSDLGYLCDGITEEIITGLSNIPLLFVIARNSSAAYKGKSVNIQQVGRDLGVQYVMEGSVRKSGDQIRITAQLIDTLTGRHIWADRYDSILEDLFALQDEITVKILSALQLKLEHGHKANIWVGATKNLIALEKYCQGNDELWTNLNFTLARNLCEEAITLDPEFAPPYVTLGWCHMIDFWLHLTDEPKKSMEKAYELINKAIQLNNAMAPAHSLLGKITYTMGNYEEGIELARYAIKVNSNEADCHAQLGCVLTYTGYPEEALYWINKAIRLNPIPSWVYFLFFGQAYNMLGRYEEAIEAYKKVLDFTPDNAFAYIGIAEGYSFLGKNKEANLAVQEVYRVFPNFSAQYHVKAYAYRFQEDTDRFLGALRKAGLR